MDVTASEKCSSTCPTQNDDVAVYLVPYRWWKEAEESISGLESDVEGGVICTASPVKITSKIFNSEIEFNLRRDDHSLQDNKECVVRISERHNDSKASTKDGISISASSGDDMCDVLIKNKKDDTCDIYPLQLRISIPYENSSLGVKISKKSITADCSKRACKIFSVDSDELLRVWDFSGQTTQIVLNGKENFTSDSQCLTVPDVSTRHLLAQVSHLLVKISISILFDEDKIKSSAAYILFCKRVDDMTGCSSETLTV